MAAGESQDPISLLTWPSELEQRQISTLRRRYHSLLSLPGAPGTAEEAPTPDDLRLLYGILHRPGVIGPHFVAVLLCAGPHEHVDRVARHVVAAALDELGREDGSRSVAEAGCRSVRQLYGDKCPELQIDINAMPSSDDGQEELEWLREHRDELRDATSNTREPTTDEKVLTLIVNLLHRYVFDRRIQRDPEGGIAHYSHRVGDAQDTDVGTASLHHFLNQNFEEYIERQPTYVDVEPSGPPAHKRSVIIQRYRTQAAASRVIRGDMRSPVQWGAFSTRTLGELVRKLRGGVESGNPVDALLAISLLTGRHVERLNGLRLRGAPNRAGDALAAPSPRVSTEALVRDGSAIALRAGFLLPLPGGDGHDSKHYAEGRSMMNVPLPTELLSCLPNRAKPPLVPQQAIDERLVSLRAELPQVTAVRIASAAYRWLYQAGYERTLLDRLLGTPLADAIPMYYERTDPERTLDAFQAWVGYLNELNPAAQFSLSNVVNKGRVGSRRTPTCESVRDLFRTYRSFVRAKQRRGPTFDISHNHFTMYTYLVLAFATGLRPARQAFETFADFCPTTSTYFIQDKDAGGVAAPRFVPVAPVAVQQLENYRTYLDELNERLDGRGPLGAYVRAACREEMPFLFTITAPDPPPRPDQWDIRGVRPEPLIPRRIAEVLGLHFPLISNWNRHLLRTELIRRNVRDDLVQAFMGHGQLGRRPFGRFSALAASRLAEVADVIEAMAHELNIRPIEGPSRPIVRHGR